ncbi:hypothetical protein G3T36_08240 [Diaminobutyricibacter tongyongensis]|uniref:Methylase-associated X1 domain-containing protein n=1 Tax=Leifsonia tongyongensis TaxID=1268043 RepID=A0A6L9XWP2_9MICO|nr:hypothetical protein [Diaminobutyricibacter tongyongensis]NEN05861.1 hypothetical protein [Diaminobutyricibacter tongyongensis]
MSTVDVVASAFERAGWKIFRQQEVFGRGANPTRLGIIAGHERLEMLVYAWRITGEGAGRKGTNYRIQTTRSHHDDLLIEGERLTMGFGYDKERDVIAVFDGWTKRATGSSSSVHIKRSLLTAAQTDGFAEDGDPWDARAASTSESADRLIDWILEQRNTRTAFVEPLSIEIDRDSAVITADLWDSSPAAWLRPGDTALLDPSADKRSQVTQQWRILNAQVVITSPPGQRYPRRSVVFRCDRITES